MTAVPSESEHDASCLTSIRCTDHHSKTEPIRPAWDVLKHEFRDAICNSESLGHFPNPSCDPRLFNTLRKLLVKAKGTTCLYGTSTTQVVIAAAEEAYNSGPIAFRPSWKRLPRSKFASLRWLMCMIPSPYFADDGGNIMQRVMSGIVKFFHVYVHCSVKDRLVVPGAELKLVSLAWPGCLSPQIQVACDLPQIPLLEYERCGDGTLVQVTVLEPYKTVNRPKEEDKGSRPTLNHPVCSGQKPGKVKASIQQAAVARPTAVVVPSQCNGTGADANSTRFNETDTNSDEEQEESDEENSKDGLQQPEPHRCSSTWKPTARSRRNRGSPSSEAEVVSPVRGKVHVSQVLRQTQKDYKVKKKAMRQRHKLRVDELKSKVKRLTWLLRESGTDGAQFDKMITRMDPGSDAAQACKAVKTRDRRQQKKAVEQSTGSSTLTKKKAKGAARG